MNRREFIQLSGLASLPLLAPRLVFGAGGQDRDILVCVYQRGAADGLNLVVPHAEPRYYSSRPTIAVAEPGSGPGSAIDLDGFFGLHPDLEALQPIFSTGDLAIVHAAGSPDDSRSHFDAQDFMERGQTSAIDASDGWLSRYLQALGTDGASTFQAVGLGRALQVSLQGEIDAIGLSTLDGLELGVPSHEQAAMNDMIANLYSEQGPLDRQAVSILQAIEQIRSADPAAIPIDNNAQYPQTEFGEKMSGVARLIKAGLGLEVACVDLEGWDHHDQEVQQMDGLVRDFGDSLAAFHADLGATMDRVSLVTMTEFGRRVEENASAGTDHGHGSIMLAMGGGVNGGQVYSDWPGLSEQDLNRGDLEVTTDYRTVLSELISKRTGVDHLDEVFPEFSGPGSSGIFQPL
jgi:uncharacterized protein (DUF1501 family)